MKTVLIWIMGGLVMAAITGGGLYWLSKSGLVAEVKVEPGAKAEITGDKEKDWGRIKMSDGDVLAEFWIKSSGDKPLLLSNLKTSCACTKARWQLGETVSPLFSMHSTSAYVMTVNPGQTVKVSVWFDPAYHGPNGVGAINRTITMQTNDPDSKELTFSAKGEVYR